MLNYRSLSCALFALTACHRGYAAVPTDFAPFNDSTSIVWSVLPLNKGDVVEVHAFKAEPGTVVLLGLCKDRCESLHVVKSIAAYRPPANNVTEKYTLEETGHLALWTARPPRQEIDAGASKAISSDSQNQVAATVQSGFSGLTKGAEMMIIRKSEIDSDHIKIRLDAGFYVTLSRIVAASP
jgi:hypothetical protein